MSGLFASTHNPDVLSCIANLSNDEVFTPPELVNQMLDMLPEELWSDPQATFLDPACKSGVFLREIAKRLNEGLEEEIPDLEERLEHIYKKQLYGIACTELTSLLSRRSLYCSKWPNSKYSVVKFDNPKGNIDYLRLEHSWENGRCRFCGAAQREYDRDESLEQYAYEFIHLDNPEEVLPVKFDVIIGNPPYQMSDGGSKASAKPIYQLFVDQAKKLNPRYLVMIIPSRWFAGGKGLDAFRDSMLKDRGMRALVDYFNSTECFPGVDLSGGVCYFLWDRDNPGDCRVESHRLGECSEMVRPLLESSADSFIRFNEAVGIVRKVQHLKEPSISKMISSRKPFGLDTKPNMSDQSKGGLIPVFAFPKNGYIEAKEISQHFEWVDQVKVCVSYAYGERGEFPYFVIGKPFIAPSGTCCTETYLVVKVCSSEDEAKNVISYMATRFFRFLVLMKKNTQHATRGVYEFVPMQDFSKPWTDEELYAKYGLAEEEIAFIESMIRPMGLGGESDE